MLEKCVMKNQQGDNEKRKTENKKEFNDKYEYIGIAVSK